jgi:methionyl aminopeptidase
MHKFKLKTPKEINIMAEGGRKLASIKKALKSAVNVGVSAEDIENLAQKLIAEARAKPSFAMVPGYKWATCVNVNDGVVHGIPAGRLVFKDGDIVSVDVGIFFKGFHTDTSFSVFLGKNAKLSSFLDVGRGSLKKAISQAKPGKTLGDISSAMEKHLKAHGYAPVRALVGHGIGRSLHEDPMIPCYSGYPSERFILSEGMVLAIEVMYAMGTGEVETAEDGWTIRTKDGKLSALFEETVAVTKDGPFVLTR